MKFHAPFMVCSSFWLNGAESPEEAGTLPDFSAGGNYCVFVLIVPTDSNGIPCQSWNP